jgi:predicted NAD/FAD-dependent oxidoreductase
VASFAIIGAGISGLACANALATAGHQVSLFDKGRGPGGRMSTRRVDTPFGQASFDHGAQFFTERDPDFQKAISALEAQGAVGLWRGKFVRFDEAGEPDALGDEPRYVGTPGMNGLVRGLAAGLNPAWGKRVSALSGQKGAWHLKLETGETLGPFDQVVCAVPAEQVSDLLAAHTPAIGEQAKAIRSLPCWAGLFAFEAPLAIDWDMARFDAHPVLDVISSSVSKPGRTGPATYIVHARPDWSIAHLEESADTVASALLEALAEICGPLPRPLVQSAHRWRYARVETSHGPGYLYDVDQGIGACGDWLSGPRVESAWLSGHHLGQALSA